MPSKHYPRRKTESISPKIRNEARVPTLITTTIHIVLEALTAAIRENKEIKEIQVGKKK